MSVIYTYVSPSGTGLTEVVSGYMDKNGKLIISDESGFYNDYKNPTTLAMYFDKMKSNVIFVENNIALEAEYIMNALPAYKEAFYHSDPHRLGVRVTNSTMLNNNKLTMIQCLLYFINKHKSATL